MYSTVGTLRRGCVVTVRCHVSRDDDVYVCHLFVYTFACGREIAA